MRSSKTWQMRVLDGLIGGNIEPQLRLLLLSIAANFAAISVLTTYFGPWLLLDLHASSTLVTVGFLGAGIIGAISALIGGGLSDRFGRGSVIFLSTLLQIIFTIALLFPISPVIACVFFILMRGTQSIRGVGQRSLVADLSSHNKIPQAFAGFRLALHCGLFSGPIIGALLLWNSWRTMLIGVVILNLISFGMMRKVHVKRGISPVATEMSFISQREMVKRICDGRFLMLFLAVLSGWMVVYSYEISLPLQLIQAHTLTPQSWGYIFALGPIMVLFLQLRVGKWWGNNSLELRLVIGAICMVTAFLLLLGDITWWLLVLVTIVFIIGDMLWGPASDSIIVSVAPEKLRGLYLGMSTMAMWLGSALAPICDLKIQALYGMNIEWFMVAALALLSAVLGVFSSMYKLIINKFL